MDQEPISRKQFVRLTAMIAATAPFTGMASLVPDGKPVNNPLQAGPSINIFSKHLHWLGYQEMATLAKDMGYDGIDLTVRPQGHVLPEKVKQDLPKAVDIIRNSGLGVYTITTDISMAKDRYTEDILKTAASLGIPNYRMGWYSYSGQGSAKDLEIFKRDLSALSQLNRKYGIHGDYENHTGRFGGPVWDLWLALKDLDPRWSGVQFDVRHASVDGAEAWPVNLDLIHSYLGSITVKDYHWTQRNGKWLMQNVPLGQGMIDYARYFKLLKDYGFNKPVSQHFEYPLGGAESGASQLSMPRDEVISHIREDLKTLKAMMAAAGLR